MSPDGRSRPGPARRHVRLRMDHADQSCRKNLLKKGIISRFFPNCDQFFVNTRFAMNARKSICVGFADCVQCAAIHRPLRRTHAFANLFCEMKTATVLEMDLSREQ